MKRRSPIKHRVKEYNRKGRRVKAHARGSGKRKKLRVTLKRKTSSASKVRLKDES